MAVSAILPTAAKFGTAGMSGIGFGPRRQRSQVRDMLVASIVGGSGCSFQSNRHGRYNLPKPRPENELPMKPAALGRSTDQAICLFRQRER
jgi:hypothetical protein